MADDTVPSKKTKANNKMKATGSAESAEIDEKNKKALNRSYIS